MLVSLEEQIILIRSQLASIERQKAKGDWNALAIFCDGIAKAATKAKEYCEAKDVEAQEEAKVKGEG